ncbi:MAG: SDR family oxidoreductase [Myxococcota bacterium]|nr:SDR family oxidoreductase [Myxococcota bacterium]
MDLQLNDKTVVITGGAKGIGEAIVRLLAKEEAIPVVVDRDSHATDKLCEELVTAGYRCETAVADLSEDGACEKVVATIKKVSPHVDALVNNAGVNDRVGIDDADTEMFLGSLRKNLLHYYGMVHHLLPDLKKTSGPIVNIASRVALTGQGHTSGYAAAKGAILALTREWAVDLRHYGIRVNAVLPAEVMTTLYREWLDKLPNPEEHLANIKKMIPLENRMTRTEEIAAMVGFLLSPQAGHITGQHLVVDGGFVHLDRSLH